MGSRREHVRFSRKVLGHLSLGDGFQRILDAHSKELGPRHRSVDHTFERLTRLAELHGPVGYAEILLHIGLDYGLIKE